MARREQELKRRVLPWLVLAAFGITYSFIHRIDAGELPGRRSQPTPTPVVLLLPAS